MAWVSRRLWVRLLGALSVCLLSAPALAQTAFVYPENVWKYDASAADLGTGWRDAAFDDSAWKQGEPLFGYGPGLSPGTKLETPAKTVYLRAAFQVKDAADVSKLGLEAAYAQGVVVYLNGQEVLRQAMPAGAVSYDTAALGYQSMALEPFDLTTGSGALVSGNNVIAVEIHQTNPASAAMYWTGWLHYETTSTRVVRGAYLQSVASTSAVVRWRTNHATDSRVSFGTDPKSLTQTLDDGKPTTEHEILLSGLTPGTSYAYAVGTTSTVLAGGDADHVFHTAPAAGNTDPVHIWILGDSGSQDPTAQKVRDAYYQASKGVAPDLWLMLGDNAYPDGTDQNYQYAIFEHMYEATLAKSSLWPTFGNHDWGADAQGLNPINDATTGTGPYFDLHTLPTAGEAGGEPSGTEGYYSFDWGNVHFMSLESIQLKTPEQIAWIEKDLATTDEQWVVAFFHVPPYTKGSHDSDEPGHEFVRLGLAKTLEDHGVDLVLGGHSHDYERSMLIDGHYQTSSEFSANPSQFTIDGGDGREDGDGAYQKPGTRAPHQGTVYVVSGKSGDRPGEGPLDHPVMIELQNPYTNEAHHGLDVSGSMELVVNGGRLDARYIDLNGQELDHFTILKGTGGSAGAGGSAGSGGAGGGAGTGGGKAAPSSGEDGGCGCRQAAGAPASPWLLLVLFGAVRRRKRRVS